jgi:hypothetical protein
LLACLKVSENPEDLRRSVQNSRILIPRLTESVIEKQDHAADQDTIMRGLRAALELWYPEERFEIRPYPVFTYVCHEFRKSVRFIRVLILREIQGLFCGAS